ncbi:hypothetical protein EDF46_3237 [Frondihabitans sp. PhB188]|uniref:hypothetical protein n=1 Tax=Frondihabitans sp. PhB188 TaxID=2485200 RepID=UPI000F47D11C|nr:hypothetical protein [Frondihabitans sp. PhB188]ROQ36694.1 hypothetical protein EDF46_3237 [Frondihabitans sp. PhB188]
MDAETDNRPDELALQREMASAVAASLAEVEWAEASLFWSELAGRRLETLSVGGHASEQPVPRAVDELGLRLRRDMAAAERGTWLSMSLVMEADGGFTCRFNYDRRVYANPGSPFTAGPGAAGPDDEAWAHDLARFPRSPRYTPAWLPGAGLGIAAPYDVLADAWGWPGVFASVEQQTDAALAANGAVPPLAPADAEAVGRLVLSAVVADVLEPHHLATLLGLHREAVGRRLLPDVPGVDGLDPALPLLEAREQSSPALLGVEAGVYGVIGDVVRARLRG